MADSNIFDLPLNQISDDQFKSFFDGLMAEKGIKERSVVIYKEFKAYCDRVQVNKSMALLEDKLDGEFLERIMHVYAFFTSCLNLVLQNDTEAHKLLILQPMIEKHITELKLD